MRVAHSACGVHTRYMSNHRTEVRSETKSVKLTIGRAKTVHMGLAELGFNFRDERVSSAIFGTDCGSDRYRNARSSFTIVSDRYEVNCVKCLAKMAGSQ